MGARRRGHPVKGFPLFNVSSGSAPQHALVAYGWDEGWDAEFTSYAGQGLLPGRVVRVDRGLCDVITPAGAVRADTSLVTPQDPMRIVCTGDWVAVDADGDPRFVRTLLPRRTAFVASTSSKRSEAQVLATNIDHIAICVSLGAELDLGRLERFLALAMSGSGGDRPLHNSALSWESGATMQRSSALAERVGAIHHEFVSRRLSVSASRDKYQESPR